MPIYEYFCNKCGVLEVIQKITDEVLKQCPNCKVESVDKIISTTSAPNFKGTGFYETDYKKNKSK